MDSAHVTLEYPWIEVYSSGETGKVWIILQITASWAYQSAKQFVPDMLVRESHRLSCVHQGSLKGLAFSEQANGEGKLQV